MDGKEKRWMLVAAAAAIVVASLVIPMEHWSGTIVSGRYVSEARIVDRSDDAIVVRLYNMTTGDDKIETGTFLTLKGEVPSDAYIGQGVRIGYSFDGLYENPSQSVQVVYFEKGTIFSGVILPLLPFGGHAGADGDLKIVDVQSDGTLLAYNRAA